MKNTTIDLKALIADIPNFPKEGILFKDISPLLRNPEAMKQVIDSINQKWYGKIDVIAGLDSRGFLFGPLLSQKMGLPFVMVRKKGKLPGDKHCLVYDLEYGTAEIEIQKTAFAEGERILVLDDLLATGGTALAACNLVEQIGAKVAGCQFVVELSDLPGREKLAGYNVESEIIF